MRTFSCGFALNTNNMKKSILTLAMAAICGSGMAQQLPNVGFENWKTTCGTTYNPGALTNKKTVRPGIEPTDWNGSNVNQLGLATNKNMCTRQEENGNKFARLKNDYAGAGEKLRSPAPGFLSLAQPWVFATSSMTDEEKMKLGNGGTYGSTAFGNKPDYIKLRYRHTAVNNEKARIIAYIWNGTFKSRFPKSVNFTCTAYKNWENCDDLDRVVMNVDANQYKASTSGDGKLIASVDHEITTDASDWTEIKIPFTYKKENITELPEKLNVIICAGDYWNRPGLQVGSTLDVDDVEFVYNSELKNATYDGETIIFDNGKAIINKSFNINRLEASSNGIGAQIVKIYNAATGVLTLRVLGNNISEDEMNFHEYTIQFNKPVSSTTYNGNLTVDATGMPSSNQTSAITVYEMPDHSKTMELKNFKLKSLGMNVGNIVLTGLSPKQSNKDLDLLRTEQTIQITDGDDESVGEWMGPSLGDVPVVFEGKMTDNRFFCNIDIDMSETIQQTIKVVFGKDFTVVNDQQAVTADEVGTKDVILNRSFAQGWNTICLPFNVKPTEIAEGAKAQEFSGVNTNALNFEEVTEMQANTPYLFFAPQAIASGKVLENKNVVEGVAKSVTKEGYAFCGTYTLTDMEGKYGVANVEGVQKIMRGAAGSSLAGTRAYFTTTNTKANGMRINLGGNGITGINQINAENVQNAAAVYNLQGVKVSNHGTTNLPAGIYIMQGKKVIVK